MNLGTPEFKVGQQVKTIFIDNKGYVIAIGKIEKVITSQRGYIYSLKDIRDSEGKILSQSVECFQYELFNIDTPDNVVWCDHYETNKVLMEERIYKLQQQLKMTKFKWQVAQKHSFHRDTDYENYVNEKLELK